MDCPLPVVSDDGDLPWSEHNSMDSDDGNSMILDQSPKWIDAFSACSTGSLTSTASHMAHAGQLSPISTGMGMSMTMLGENGNCNSATTAPPMIHSASSSSCADSWSIGLLDSDDLSVGETTSNNDVDIHWEQGSDDVLTVPKLEPVDDDFCFEDVKEAPMTPVPSNSGPTPAGTGTKVKRPRGRPRKHPVATVVNANKVTKGRSKTGCITCRKRKKKCDEAKPRCMNCEKNAVVCEGYPEKQIWKSGKERAEEALLTAHSLPVITMQPIFNGLETLEDRIFWKHYNDHLSAVLTVEGEHKNAFKEMLIPIATQHQGLMHSILSLASHHLDHTTPYGINLLKKYPDTSIEALADRSAYHHQEAMRALTGQGETKASSDVVLPALFGQILCRLLELSIDGKSTGEHRFHLDHYQKLMQSSPPHDPAFLTFITEFFQYQIFADELIRYPARGDARLACAEWTPMQPIRPARLLGVSDGLFKYLCQITTIRNNIRDNMAAQLDPVVDYTSLYQAAEIEDAIRDWTPQWPSGDSRDRVGLLYKQMMWVYLYRTIKPPSPASNTNSASSSSASLMNPNLNSNPSFNPNPNPISNGRSNTTAGSSSIIQQTPPRSEPTSCSSSPNLRPNSAGAAGLDNGLYQHQHHHHQQEHQLPPHSPRRHSIAHPLSSSLSSSGLLTLTPHTNVDTPVAIKYEAIDDEDDHHHDHDHGHDSITIRSESPPPNRFPPHHDSRITLAVDESLAILDSFKPSDPAQTLLLIPCLVIGSACFNPSQQARVRAAVRTVKGYTGLRNTDRVGELLEEVWRLMGQGDWAAVWDWQGAADRMGLDFLCT